MSLIYDRVDAPLNSQQYHNLNKMWAEPTLDDMAMRMGEIEQI